MMHRTTSRRTFLAATAAASLAWPLRRVRGANDQVRIAVLGVRSKGWQHVGIFRSLPGVRVVTLCDPDQAILDRRAEESGEPVKKETDLRAVLEDKDVDAVVVATPNHWHALATIWACQAGKDVYVEKPAAYDLWEGRQMMAAAAKYNRVVQAGMQRRSDEALMSGLTEIRDGKLGRIHRVNLVHYAQRAAIGRTTTEVPDSVDYNLYAGPAPMSPIRRDNLHYDWHWFWETGNGELGNNGPHGIDLARFVLDQHALPPRVWSVGGRYKWDDLGETPNTHITYLDYDPAPIIAEVRNLPAAADVNAAPNLRGVRTGIIVDCEDGYFSGLNGGAIYDHDDNRIETVDGDGGRHHQANFIKAVRSRNAADITCNAEDGHLSGSLCHLGNIAYRVGAEATSEQIHQAIESDTAGRDSFDRMTEHLAANEVDLEAKPLTFGPSLTFDPTAERFTGPSPLTEAANNLRRRDYRRPFVVPEQV
ncbi:MAG: Gfo/Idh/MocA family oxidoreductase [Phycisphaeraceae bacterium]